MLAVISMYTEDCKQFIKQAINSVRENNAKMFLAYEKSKVKPSTIQLFDENKDVVVKVEKHNRKDPAVVYAHNDALQEAIDSGAKVFARLDSDNYFIPNALQAMQIFLKRKTMIYGDHIKLAKIDDEWIVVGISSSPQTVTAGELIRELNKIPGNAIMYDLDFAKKVAFWDETIEGGWDVEMYVRACCHGFKLQKIPVDNPIVVCERIRNNSLFHESKETNRWNRWRNELLYRMVKYRNLIIKEVFKCE